MNCTHSKFDSKSIVLVSGNFYNLFEVHYSLRLQLDRIRFLLHIKDSSSGLCLRIQQDNLSSMKGAQCGRSLLSL